MSFVSVSDIFQSYGKRPILERVNLEVAEGEFVSIVGASGCGKSTFLRLLLAQERPTRGTISIAGAPPAQEPDRDRGVVFQRYSVFPHMTVRGNLIAAEEFGGAGPVPRFFGGRRRDAAARGRGAPHAPLALLAPLSPLLLPPLPPLAVVAPHARRRGLLEAGRVSHGSVRSGLIRGPSGGCGDAVLTHTPSPHLPPATLLPLPPATCHTVPS